MWKLSLKRGFLIDKNNGDSKKKFFHTELVMPLRTSSSKFNFKSLDRSKEIEYKKEL